MMRDNKSLIIDTASNIFDNKVILFGLYPFLCLLLWSRRLDCILNPQPWAEDGAIFIHDAFCHSINSIFIPYAGYYHPLARVATFFATSVSLNPNYALN